MALMSQSGVSVTSVDFTSLQSLKEHLKYYYSMVDIIQWLWCGLWYGQVLSNGYGVASDTVGTSVIMDIPMWAALILIN